MHNSAAAGSIDHNFAADDFAADGEYVDSAVDIDMVAADDHTLPAAAVGIHAVVAGIHAAVAGIHTVDAGIHAAVAGIHAAVAGIHAAVE